MSCGASYLSYLQTRRSSLSSASGLTCTSGDITFNFFFRSLILSTFLWRLECSRLLKSGLVDGRYSGNSLPILYRMPHALHSVPLPAGGAEPAERVQGVRQAPQQDNVQVPCAQIPPRRRRLHARRPPGVFLPLCNDNRTTKLSSDQYITLCK